MLTNVAARKFGIVEMQILGVDGNDFSRASAFFTPRNSSFHPAIEALLSGPGTRITMIERNKKTPTSDFAAHFGLPVCGLN